MRIYNFRRFAGGIIALLLAVGCGAALAIQGFQTRLLVSLILLLALGGADIAWALNREARLPRGMNGIGLSVRRAPGGPF